MALRQKSFTFYPFFKMFFLLITKLPLSPLQKHNNCCGDRVQKMQQM